MLDHIPLLADDVPCLPEFGYSTSHSIYPFIYMFFAFTDAQSAADGVSAAPVSDEFCGCHALPVPPQNDQAARAVYFRKQDIQ